VKLWPDNLAVKANETNNELRASSKHLGTSLGDFGVMFTRFKTGFGTHPVVVSAASSVDAMHCEKAKELRIRWKVFNGTWKGSARPKAVKKGVTAQNRFIKGKLVVLVVESHRAYSY